MYPIISITTSTWFFHFNNATSLLLFPHDKLYLYIQCHTARRRDRKKEREKKKREIYFLRLLPFVHTEREKAPVALHLFYESEENHEFY